MLSFGRSDLQKGRKRGNQRNLVQGWKSWHIRWRQRVHSICNWYGLGDFESDPPSYTPTRIAPPPRRSIMSLETLSTISPTTNTAVVTRQAPSPEDIARLPPIGQEAFASYRTSHATLGSRQEVVAKALKLLSKRKDVLARELTEQMGRPIAYTGIEIDTAVKRGEYLNRIAGEVLEQDVPGDPEKGFRRYIRREPVGVVLIIFAWNVRISPYTHHTLYKC